MKPVITSVGLLSPLGLGREDFVARWSAGESAEVVEGGVPAAPFKVPRMYPAHRRLFRRIDRLSKMMCAAAALARDDTAGLGERAELGLAFGTDLGTLEETWAFLNRLRDKGPQLANPMAFPNLVPNAGPGYVGLVLGIEGPSQTFCLHEICGDEALHWAADAVASGWIPGALVGGAEELGPVRRAAARRVGCGDVLPGEGATALLVEAPERAAARGAIPLAQIAGLASGSRPGETPLVRLVEAAQVAALVGRALDEAAVAACEVGLVSLSHPDDNALVDGLRLALGEVPPSTDHHRRVGSHPADGAFRAALAALALGDPALPVNAAGERRRGDAAVVLSSARGGALSATVLTGIR